MAELTRELKENIISALIDAEHYGAGNWQHLINALRAPREQPVSRDAVLVPREPTTEMVNAGVGAMRNDGWSLDRDELAATLQLVYKAMLSAGTQP